jgi:creatinine amidohydrolase
VGPDRIRAQQHGVDLVGMDTADSTTPHRQLPGSLYWVPKGLFLQLLEAILAQACRAGFRCIVADGHGPSRNSWAEMADSWEQQFGLKLISARRDFPDKWRTQTDHAGRNETSIMMAVAPELVDLSQLPQDRDQWPQGVAGEDPRDATAAHGDESIEDTLALIGARLDELGI